MEGLIHGEELKEFNEAAIKMWNTAVLVECVHCQRTFFPQKLRKHQTSCTKMNPMKNPNKTRGNASRQEALVNYPQEKKRKYVKESLKSTNASKEADSKMVNTSEENKPMLSNILDAIKDNQISQDKELSSQLLHLMDYLIESKLKSNQISTIQ
jgi:recombination DNA repair RAD52 pathway protein